MIVTYNSVDVITPCLEALRRMAPAAEVVVIDNGSTDGTADVAGQFSQQVRVVRNGDNRGFAGGVNQGFRETSAPCILVLNPDVRLDSPLDSLEAACQEHGLAAGLLKDEYGQAQAGFTVRRLPNPTVLALELLGINRLWRNNPWNREYRCADFALDQPGFVEQPAGAFLMIRRDVWRQLGGFDEQFHPVWFEDVDFCARSLKKGYKIRYVPAVQAIHRGGHSVGRIPREDQARFWYASLLKYAAKHFSSRGYRAVCLAAGISTVPRMVAGMIQQRSLNPIATYSQVLRLVGQRILASPAPVEHLG